MAQNRVAVEHAMLSARNNLQKRDIDRAMELAGLVAWYDDNTAIEHFIDGVKQR